MPSLWLTSIHSQGCDHFTAMSTVSWPSRSGTLPPNSRLVVLVEPGRQYVGQKASCRGDDRPVLGPFQPGYAQAPLEQVGGLGPDRLGCAVLSGYERKSGVHRFCARLVYRHKAGV